MKARNPKISVILPVYNVEKFLYQCLDSICNQTLKDIEIICIDDGSTDNSLEILNKYAQNDNRFIVISQENQSQGVARNKGIELSTGECISFVDPDDWLEPNAFENLYNNYKEYNADMIIFDHIFNREESHNPNEIYSFSKSATSELLGFNFVNKKLFSWKDFTRKRFAHFGFTVWNRFYSSKFIKENNIKCASNRYGEDQIFSLKCMVLAKKILYLNTPFYHYRERVNSATNSGSDEKFCIFGNIRLFQEFLETQNLLDEYSVEFNEYAVGALAGGYLCIPEKSHARFKKIAKEMLSKEDYCKFLKQIKCPCSFLENIFSVKNIKINGLKRKNIRVFGFDFVI